MPTPLLTTASTVLCAHGGTATPLAPSPRVRVAGAPAVAFAPGYVVAGCPFPPPPAGNGPCTTAQWLLGSARVTLGGQPAVVGGGLSLSTPTGTPLHAIVVQSKVVAG